MGIYLQCNTAKQNLILKPTGIFLFQHLLHYFIGLKILVTTNSMFEPTLLCKVLKSISKTVSYRWMFLRWLHLGIRSIFVPTTSWLATV